MRSTSGAARPRPGGRGFLRVAVAVWERYIEEVIRCGSSSVGPSNTRGSTIATAVVSSARRAVMTSRPPRPSVGFAPEYKPVKRFPPRDELHALLGALTTDRAACVAFMVATSAEWGAVERARREDVSVDSSFAHVRGTKRATRDRHVPIVSDEQRSLLAYAMEHAQGEGGVFFLPWQNVRRDLGAACERLGMPSCSPNDLRRTCAKWLRAAGVAPHLLAPLFGQADSRMAERVYGRLEPAELAVLLGESLGRTVAPVQQIGPDPAIRGGLAGHREVANPLKMAPWPGLEPGTRGLTVRCSTN
jgi:integrase